jgi:hypothetical protein
MKDALSRAFSWPFFLPALGRAKIGAQKFYAFILKLPAPRHH